MRSEASVARGSTNQRILNAMMPSNAAKDELLTMASFAVAAIGVASNAAATVFVDATTAAMKIRRLLWPWPLHRHLGQIPPKE